MTGIEQTSHRIPIHRISANVFINRANFDSFEKIFEAILSSILPFFVLKMPDSTVLPGYFGFYIFKPVTSD